MTDREKFEVYFAPVAEIMNIHGVDDFEIACRKDQQWQGWQAALASQQPADDGWIEWAGGEDPSDMLVDVKFRDGDTSRDNASVFMWGHCDDEYDIIAYRVVKP